jgi:hypothetical protein
MLEEILGAASARKLKKVLSRLSEELERGRAAVAAGRISS